MNIDHTKQTILTVSQFNQLAHGLLKDFFPTIWVEGEISNFIRAGSKHWYFSLKDSSAQIRCVMFYSNQRTIKFQPENGMHIVVRGAASLYENRGDFQLIIDYLEELGFGALQRAFEQLKTKLQKEGLFDESRKKTLPILPQHIGVITSPTGAAIHDVLSVLKRRFPIATVTIYPTSVQGEEAAGQIVKAIQTANLKQECNVLLLCRGGGSIEDLWPFNEEIVARAIFNSAIPIISGVGHEVDFTIADFVADCRAPTPSAAAELAVPDQQKLIQQLHAYRQQLGQTIDKKIKQYQLRLNWLNIRVTQNNPKNRLQQQAQRLDQLVLILFNRFSKLFENKKQQLLSLTRTLEAISPFTTLKRGYAVVYDKHGSIVQNSKSSQVGEKIKIQLADGQLHCTVDEIEEL